MAKNRKLGRTSDIRKSMLRSLAPEVIMYGKYSDVNGGYTRILKTYNRKGDNAPMAIIALV